MKQYDSVYYVQYDGTYSAFTSVKFFGTFVGERKAEPLFALHLEQGVQADDTIFGVIAHAAKQHRWGKEE